MKIIALVCKNEHEELPDTATLLMHGFHVSSAMAPPETASGSALSTPPESLAEAPAIPTISRVEKRAFWPMLHGS